MSKVSEAPEQGPRFGELSVDHRIWMRIGQRVHRQRKLGVLTERRQTARTAGGQLGHGVIAIGDIRPPRIDVLLLRIVSHGDILTGACGDVQPRYLI